MERLAFTERVDTRVSPHHVEIIEALVKHRRDLWENRSHFVRCAIIQFIEKNRPLIPI